MRALLEKYHNYALSVSSDYQTAQKGETDGKDYFFVSQEKFKQMIEEEQLIEYAQYVNHYYGTPKEYVLRQMAEGKDVDSGN